MTKFKWLNVLALAAVLSLGACGDDDGGDDNGGVTPDAAAEVDGGDEADAAPEADAADEADAGDSAAAEFCADYDETCGEELAFDDCLTAFEAAAEGTTAGYDSTQDCMIMHLDNAEAGNPDVHCPHAAGEELCVPE